MFIIWDRMFGTYIPEIVRQDVYGLQTQPNTFDPIKLNTQHIVRMGQLGDELVKASSHKKTDGDGDGNGGSDKGEGKGAAVGGVSSETSKAGSISLSWWRLILRKRAHHRFVCDPRLLFKPIPPMRADMRGQKKRVKWDGSKTGSNWSPWLAGAFMATVGIAVLVGGVGVLLQSHAMHLCDALGCVVMWCLCSSAILQFCDQQPSSASKAAVQSVALLPILYGIMLARPAELLQSTAAGHTAVHVASNATHVATNYSF